MSVCARHRENLLRRDLTDDMRAVLIGMFREDVAAELEAKRRQAISKSRSGETMAKRPSSQSKTTRQVLAEKAGVSTHKIRQAEAVQQADPELAKVFKKKASRSPAHFRANLSETPLSGVSSGHSSCCTRVSRCVLPAPGRSRHMAEQSQQSIISTAINPPASADRLV